MLQERIGLIGAGQMATALARGWLRAGLTTAERILASDVDPEARRRFSEAVGATTSTNNAEVAAQSDVLLLAVKPQQLAQAASALRAKLSGRQLVVSIAAGVRLVSLAEWLGPKPRLARVMPNTPCLIGQGACGYCLGQGATADAAEVVGRMLGAVGRAWQVEEKLLDAVTGLSGSGPAFVCVMIEALADAGVRMGLPRQTAVEMAAQTLSGTAQLVLQTGEHPAVWKDRVASPGGTTIAGLQAIESGGLRAALMDAVEAAAWRSKELGSST